MRSKLVCQVWRRCSIQLATASSAVGIERDRPVLRFVTTPNQTRALQHLDVLRDCGELQVERLGELVHGGRTVGQAGEDRPTGRVGQRSERLVQSIVVEHHRHLCAPWLVSFVFNYPHRKLG